MAYERSPIAVFDIGGTWFRSALFTNGGLVAIEKRPSVNFLTSPGVSVAALQDALVDYLVARVAELRAEMAPDLRNASIALGAALDPKTGTVFNSGPMWGPECRPFNLVARLDERAPQVKWHLHNDVSASLLEYVLSSQGEQEKSLLITVSSGIGARLFDGPSNRIPVDRSNGMQGEIGHLKVSSTLRGARMLFTCDCGGSCHLNAYSSGRGITNMTKYAERVFQSDFKHSSLSDFGGNSSDQVFQNAIFEGDGLAVDILNCATRPLARILATILTYDPLIDRIVMTGGVVNALGARYLDSLVEQFNDIGLFQVSEREPDFLRRRLRVTRNDDLSGLTGAGYLGRAVLSGRDPYQS